MNNQYFEVNISPENLTKERFLNRLFFTLKLIFLIISGVFAYFAFMFFNILWFLVAFTLTIALVFHFFERKFYNFYDLIFVDGALSIVKVYGNAKRKTITRFDCKSIKKIGLVGGETFYFYIKDKDIKKYYTKNNLNVNDLTIFIDSTEKSLLLIPYNEKLLSAIIKIIGAQKLEKGLIDKIKNT